MKKTDLIDTLIHQGQRKRLVDELRKKGIQSESVLSAMNSVPRQWFFPKDFEHFVYRDAAFPIDHGQTISQPYTVAYQSQLLGIDRGAKVLEIAVPDTYIQQLSIGGRLVIPVGDQTDEQKMMRITKISNTQTKTEILQDCKFVPLKGSLGWK